jgi:hypothetical protein
MPIGAFEREILRLLARNRNPDSFVAGATVLLLDPATARESQDVDIFHDTAESLRVSYEAGIAVLRETGYDFELVTTQPTFRRGLIRRGGQATKIEWVFDSAFRFFPIETDEELGFHLNFWDAATNKLLALAGRREVRDYIDVLHLHRQHLHLGALAWAAAGKDAGMTPEFVLDLAGRNTKFQPEDLAAIRLSQPVDLRECKKAWILAKQEAEDLIERLPTAEMGCLYLDSTGKPVRPDPNSPDFAKLTRHFGCVKGAWPRIVDES